ncbi:MAG: FtsX-like permease family protein [Coriobacteriia bacterium]|nr:FtsX-like permease family protein [Coriobacteriia bacterium]
MLAYICAKASIASTPAIVEGIQGIVGQVVHGVTTAIAEKMMAAMSSIDMDFNISSDQMMQLAKLMSGSGSRSYEGNLADFGYADLENPVSIIIYPNDFYAKEIISNKIDGYNDEQQESGHEEKVISYTDYAKLLMSSLTTVIDMITAVLVAFVAISLVVSSIMIGIITYISVLERRREIGILRAIGARKRDIFNVFNAETFIIGLIAGFIGIGFTAIGCIPANIIAHAAFNVQYDIAILPI